MIIRQPLEIIDSWIFGEQGIIVELKCSETGIMRGIKLVSRLTGQKWVVKSRLLFHHAADRQKRFQNETETLMKLAFTTADKREKSKDEIMYKEEHGIYQYLVNPIEHSEKPIIGDLIDIEEN